MAPGHTVSESKVKSQCRDLQNLLRQSFGDGFIVVDYSIDDLVPPGENFRSSLLKIVAKVKRSESAPIEDCHLVAKTIVELAIPVDWTNLLKKEIFMYTDVIPFFEMIEVEFGLPGEKNTIGESVPSLCGHRMSLDPRVDVADSDAVILLENIKEKGYYVVDKNIGLDLDHSTKALTTLARFHALGIAAKAHFPTDFALLKSKCLKSGFNYCAMDAMYRRCAQSIILHPRFRAYAPFVEAAVDRRRGGAFDLVTREPWATVVHNDFWTNNIMFRKDGRGRIDGLKFLDFQTYAFADVFIDLTYFLCTSLSDKVRRRHFDVLVDVYYDAFVRVLRKLRVNVEEFSRVKFDEQFKRDAGYDFLHCVVALKFFTTDVAERDDVADRAKFISNIMNCDSNELYYDKVAELLRIFQERDWLR